MQLNDSRACYHASGSRRTGSDAAAVTDTRRRVCGVDALRVVGCPVVPAQVSSGIRRLVMALAWRATDLIIKDERA